LFANPAAGMVRAYIQVHSTPKTRPHLRRAMP
jgi:hypothetical protein